MIKNILTIMLLVLLGTSAAIAAEKGKPVSANATTQESFTATYLQKKAAGGQEYMDWKNEVAQQGTLDDNNMFQNLESGMTAGGKKKSKQELAADQQKMEEMKSWFMGDKTDKGPSDWSDYIIETDKDGNVTGFKEKDFEQKDADGDGKISDEERKNWNDKVDKDNKDNGGAPGEVDITKPDWDKDGDGNPDAGFELDCWRCQAGKKPQCQDGVAGMCGPNACDRGMQCSEHTETFDNVSLICHACLPNDRIVDACADKGYMADSACNGQCPPIACVPLDIDKQSAQVVPSMQTRAKDSTMRCYGCMNVTDITIEYYVLIIETPYTRFVLGKGDKPAAFKPSSIMALAKAGPSGKISNTLGDLRSVSDFLGGLNIGSGIPGLATTGKLGVGQLTSMLGQGLNKSGSYGSSCFDQVVDEADKDAASTGNPTSQDIQGKGKSAKKGKEKSSGEAVSSEQINIAEQSGTPAVSGPIVACGNEGKDKVLKIYDATGAVVDTITQAMLKANPSIITEKLGIAQQFTDRMIAKSGFDFASYVEKFTGLPLKDMQAVAAQIVQAKGIADQALQKGKSKKKVKKAEEVIVPNDPLYMVSTANKKKQARKIASKKSILTVTQGVISGSMDESLQDKLDKASLIPDQYALHRIGYTPYSDINSAWNVVDVMEKNVVVAVIDSGLDMTHEDGPQHIWSNPKEIPGNSIDDDNNGFVDDIHGWNFVDDSHDLTDVKGHGTFVAGIIAAKQNNGKGIAGINPGAVIMPIKAADEEGQTDNWAIYRSINYAVNHGAKIINVSLGGRTVSKLEQQAIDRASAFGVLVVIAAGNSNEDMMQFGPSSSKKTIAVGETNYTGERSTASNWGPNLGLVAPGENIFSLCSKDNKHVLPSVRKYGYYALNGTSFSTPMVAATASLILAKNPNLTHQQVADILMTTATDMGDKGWDGMTGSGMLNASKALREAMKDQVVVMITNLRFNKDRKGKVVSVDVFGTARGPIREFIVEAGKGKLAGRFAKVAGPFKDVKDYGFIARLVIQDVLRGSDEWILRIKAIDTSGQEHVASTPMTLPK
jgi:hypothetical protein